MLIVKLTILCTRVHARISQVIPEIPQTAHLQFRPKPEGCITPRKGVRDVFGPKNPSILGPGLRIFPRF